MEEEISRMKNFLKDFSTEQSPTSDEATRIGNYSLDAEDVSGHVMDWIINYLDNRKCPYSLAVSIAKEIALQISAFVTQNEAENVEKMFNSADLYSEAICKIPSVCTTFSNQDNLEPISSTKYATSVFAIRNKRRKMEDRHVILHDLNAVLDLKDAPHQSYYAVFDGHSGIDAACYASAQLHFNIGKHPDFLTNTSKAIAEGYQITDLNFLNKCNKLNIKSGCTALSAFIRNNTIFLSWLGDSQAVLVKEGVPIKITSPHKPDRQDERQRIEELGGQLIHMGTWRVNGMLAVTRAIGDSDHKPYISSEPELDIINLDGTEDFLILACDGLWDGISPEDASSALYRYLADNSPSDLISPIAAKLVHQAKLQGSEDNITAIVVFLRDVKDIINNANKILSNSSMYYAQNHDFMSMNGNMKILSMDSNSDATFSKPTVLELNAASSKKLKNAANVMSSAGFGSSSYSYQFVENLEESSFQSAELSVDSSQTTYIPQATHSASCFAPEATALSELPTPPIDDMLASQQFDNFSSTDLYKELKDSVQISEQHLETVHKTELSVSNVEVASQLINKTVEDAENKSLYDMKNNSGSVCNPALSADDAIGIASDVVSTTIETAVKCLSEESVEPTQVQSSTKLNPYAKPFVMKSFFSTEGSDPMSNSFIGSNLGEPLSPCEADNSKHDDQSIIGISGEIDSNRNISEELKKNQLSNVATNQPSIDLISVEPLVPEQSICSDSVSNILPLDVPANEPEHKTPEHLNEENSSSDNFPQTISNTALLCEFEQTSSTETNHDQVTSEKTEVCFSGHINQPIHAQLSDMSLLSMDFEKMQLKSLRSESDLMETNICASTEDLMPLIDENKLTSIPLSSESQTFPEKFGDISSDLSAHDIASNISEIEPKAENKHSIDNIEKYVHGDFQAGDNETVFITDVQVDQLQINKQEKMLISEAVSLKSEENIILTSNQTSVLLNSSEKLNSGGVEADIKSKFEEIEKSIVNAVVKNENSESSCFVEPISLITNIKDELISAESEVPSDPSVEDSRAEPVAVDLKSLPEGIPEAEGVTEDIDSDSEKDGGWSYMKGNIVTGSKLKSEEKTSKTTKSNEAKSNIATKSKRDLSKPNLDIKNKVKTAVDKTKSSVPDKSKTVSQDKTKNIADKTKVVTSIDKNRTSATSDKTKKIEKKIDVKSKILKSSTASATKLASVSNTTRKATAEITGSATTTTTSTTTSVNKPVRPTTLIRTSAISTDKNSLSNRAAAKSKVTSLPSDNKPVKPNVASSVKGPVATQSKSSTLSNRTTATTNRTTATNTLSNRMNATSTLSNRTAPTRPAATAKTSTIGKTTAQKSMVNESKPKLPSTVTSLRRPPSAAAKKPDVKEVKDTVNKQISAKKTTASSRMETNSALANKRTVSYNNRSAAAKPPGTAKMEINKREVPKMSAKPGVKKVDSKITQEVTKSKEKIIESAEVKTADEAKDNSNPESDQQNVTEAAEGVEEKFILETNDKEIPKDMEKNSHEEQIVENGSFIKTISPDEVIPVTECNPENQS